MANDPFSNGTTMKPLLVLTAIALLAAPASRGDTLPRVLERAILPIRVQAPLWGRFETAIVNPRPYANPYRDVSLDAVFTRPDGGTVRFWGFYDGGQTWRMRFMPDQPGEWRYEARFSDGPPAAQGAFLCVPSDLPGMIAPDESNPAWFGYRGGDAVLVRGLHVGDRFFARNWDDPANPADGERRSAFLDWAQRQGYNLLSVASHYLNRNSAGRGRGWNTPKLWPLSAAEYQSMEAVLDDLASRRILAYPFAGFFGRSSSYPDNPADQALYLRYTYARLGAYWNLLLNVAGPEPLLPNNAYLTRDQVNRLGSDIQRLNVFAKPISIHNPTGNDLFLDEPWLTYGTLQGPKTVDRAALAAILLRNHHPRKPLLAQETLWSGNINHIRSIRRDYTDDDLRKNAIVIHFSAASLVFADNDGDSSSGYSGTMDPKDCRQNRHDAVRLAWDLCAALPFTHLQPCPGAVSGRHAFCLADPGREYLIYLERTAPVIVTLEGGPYEATWTNARQPSGLEAGGAVRTGQVLEPPSHGDDWILRLRRSAE